MRWFLAFLPLTLVAETALVTPRELAAQVPPTPSYTVQRAQFTLASQVPGNPTLTCHIAWAETADGSVPPRRQDLVLYLQHPKERFYQPSTQSWEWKPYEHLVSEGGFTVCGVFFENMGEEQIDVLGDRQRSYIYQESHSYAALRTALDEVRRRRQLPTRPVFTFGLSAGGMLSQRFAEAHPDQVDAVAALGGGLFHQQRGSHAAHLLVSTLGDVTEEDHRGLLRWLSLRGIPAAWMQTTPDWSKRHQKELFYHCHNRASQVLALRWLEGVADLRRSGVPLSDTARWPYVADLRDPGRIAATTAPGWRREIPADLAEPLPSAAAALAWMATPYRPSDLAKGMRWARPSATVKPSAVVVHRWHDRRAAAESVTGDPSLGTMGHRDWDLLQLADQGVIACATDAPLRDVASLRATLLPYGIADDLPVVVLETVGDAVRSQVAGAAGRCVVAMPGEVTAEAARALLGEGAPGQTDLLVFGDPKQQPPAWAAASAGLPGRGRLVMIDDRERTAQAVHAQVCERILDLVRQHELQEAVKPARRN
jgi:pimeloyl-ACP methyl ester carboxylesterase